jgi:exonuclease III
MTLNIRGLQTGMVDTQEVLAQHQPDILILTETKASKRNIKRIQAQLGGKGYWQHHSIVTHQDPRAGVAILVHQKFGHLGWVQEISYPDNLKGYIATIQISHESYTTPLEVTGVYVPTTGAQNNQQLRASLYDAINTRVTLANNESEGIYNTIVAGDFNATLVDSDRLSGKTLNIDKKTQEVHC